MSALKKILIIEDNSAIRELLTTILQDAGFQVIPSENGNAGLKALDSLSFDLVITDMVMPGKNGLSTIMEIKTRFPEQKIIAMSGSDKKKEFLETAVQFGASHFIGKPFTADDLLAAVAKVMPV
jgi:DNA-binding NtrC family response regulator